MTIDITVILTIATLSDSMSSKYEAIASSPIVFTAILSLQSEKYDS